MSGRFRQFLVQVFLKNFFFDNRLATYNMTKLFYLYRGENFLTVKSDKNCVFGAEKKIEKKNSKK